MAMAITTIDQMEYASDALAQAAYVTDAGYTTPVTGGSISKVGSKIIHTFTSSGTFEVPSGITGNVDYLVVAGGGAGGWSTAGNSYAGAGGGAGGLRTGSLSLTSGSKTVTVGNGGTSSTTTANNGEDSVFDSITAVGGGAGAHGELIDVAGSYGGSGGGGTCNGTYGDGESGQGYHGGVSTSTLGGSAGGGGASAVGGNPVEATGKGGVGGAGSYSSISGSSTPYGGGGAGGSYNTGNASSSGGVGGGGAGGIGDSTTHQPGTAGSEYTGGGGGGAGSGGASAVNASGGAGGSGIVIVSYDIGQIGSAYDLWAHTESSILQSGSYAIKGVAFQTTSLNKTLTRTISTPIDLTGKTNLVGYIRSSRSGSNIKVGIHDSGGTTTEVTPNITSADTWQLIDLDISGVSDANKDAIDSIIITIVNADDDNTFYIDDLFAVTDPVLAASKAVGYVVLSPIQPALNVSKLVGYAVISLPTADSIKITELDPAPGINDNYLLYVVDDSPFDAYQMTRGALFADLVGGCCIAFEETEKPKNQAVYNVFLDYNLTIAADCVGCDFYNKSNPSAEVEVSIEADGTEIATLTVSSGGSATWATVGNSSKYIPKGSKISFIFPAQDSTWAGAIIMFKGTRSIS